MQTRTAQVVVDSRGRHWTLGNELNHGGEARIFEVLGSPDSVAKIYLKPPDELKAKKLTLMVKMSSGDLSNFCAWPVELLKDNNTGGLKGFLMPIIQGHPSILRLYNPSYRKNEFPKADWSFLVHAAVNCCAAFDTVHERDLVIGDVNESNVQVSHQAMIKLIDCDSFEFMAEGVTFFTGVGKGDFNPPELQGKYLEHEIRTKNHDNFGLAVIIFKLLRMGRHPFMGHYIGPNSGNESTLIEDAISKNHFAYSEHARALFKLEPPPNTLPITFLPSNIRTLFEMAFDKDSALGRRPTAKAWGSALNNLARHVRTCARISMHKYSDHLSQCPWCEQDSNGHWFFLPPRTTKVHVTALLDTQFLSVFLVEVDGLDERLPVVLNPTTVAPIPQTLPAAEIIASKRYFDTVGWCALGSFLLTIGSPVIAFLAFVVFSVWWLMLRSAGCRYTLRREQLENELREINTQFNEVKRQEQEIVNMYASAVRKLKELASRYRNLQTEFNSELEQLKSDAQNKQLETYLEDQKLVAGLIRGIGETLILRLKSIQIENARDLNGWTIEQIVNEHLYGLGHEKAERLFDWYEDLKRHFVPDPNNAIPQGRLQLLRAKYIALPQRLESELRKRRHDLAAEQSTLTQQAKQLLTKEQHLEAQKKATQNDLDQLRVV